MTYKAMDRNDNRTGGQANKLHQKLISMLLSMLRKRMAELNSTVNFHGTIIIKLDR